MTSRRELLAAAALLPLAACAVVDPTDPADCAKWRSRLSALRGVIAFNESLPPSGVLEVELARQATLRALRISAALLEGQLAACPPAIAPEPLRTMQENDRILEQWQRELGAD